MVVSTRPGENMEDSGPTADRPDVDCEMCHPTLAVTDVRAAIEFYTTKLGFWVAFAEADPPTFAGVNLGRVQIFLEHGTPAPEGCSVYFVVSDADALHRFHRSRGVEILESADDRPYKLRDYTVRDLYGYRLTFGHRLP
jgi:catechol 2,3-dioxygenase-like lactoylglutathione lyase family enzyme